METQTSFAAPHRVVDAEPAVRLTDVRKSYGANHAVLPLDLVLRRGETVALLGPNGAGKSTTIGMILGLVAPDAGDIRVAGRTPARAVADGCIAAMLQDAGLMPGIRVAELVRLGERCYPHAIATADALRAAGLDTVAKRRVDRLSGGQSQRLRFALALVANADILLLDEPTRALDVQGRAEFWTTMRAYAATGKTVLFATHYLDEVDENADRVIVLAGGRIVADGTPDAVRGFAGTSVVRFRLDGQVDATTALIGGMPGVIVVDVTRDALAVTCTDADAVVRALARSTLPWHGIDVAPPDLDSTFIRLTAPAAPAASEES
jgi:ABC-2 type transport system ATP-binding protein